MTIWLTLIQWTIACFLCQRIWARVKAKGHRTERPRTFVKFSIEKKRVCQFVLYVFPYVSYFRTSNRMNRFWWFLILREIGTIFSSSLALSFYLKSVVYFRVSHICLSRGSNPQNIALPEFGVVTSLIRVPVYLLPYYYYFTCRF